MGAWKARTGRARWDGADKDPRGRPTNDDTGVRFGGQTVPMQLLG
jgi:hypothetical protein